MEEVVRLEGLWKLYGGNPALRNINLTIPEGSMFLLMGPNGSGKTTLLKIVLGLVKPTRGVARVLGLDPWKKRHEMFKRVGAMLERHSMPKWTTGRRILEYLAKLKGLREPRKEALKVAKIFEVDEYWDRNISTYSAGMLRKIAVAHAFLGDPELIVLDEPMVTLDKQTRLILRNIIRDRKDRTYIVSSHVVMELEEIATHIAVLNRGRIVIAGSIRDVAEKLGLNRIMIKTSNMERALRILVEKEYDVRASSGKIIVETAQSPKILLELLEKENIEASIEIVEPSVWSIYAKSLLKQ